MSRADRAWLAGIVALLWIGLALRVHHPLNYAAFVDENHHIRRAAQVAAFDQNPIAFSHGKLLFYYWLAPFAPGGASALAIGRLATALPTLLTGAATTAIARRLFGRRTALLALGLLTAAPLALFHERLALSDSFAGTLAALTVWAGLRLAEHPTRGRGALAGLLAALTPLAKLTAAGALGLPLAALALTSARPWTDRYLKHALIAAALAAGVVAALALALVLMPHPDDDAPEVLDRYLVDGRPGLADVADNVADAARGLAAFLSTPSVLALPPLAGLALWRWPRPAALALIWLIALWAPALIFGTIVFTRYLLPGLPALAILAAGGLIALVELPRQPSARRAAGALVIGALAIWLAAFVAPFAGRLMGDPAGLRLPPRDAAYLSGPHASWGAREALESLERDGARLDGRVPVLAVLTQCGSSSLHVTDAFDWACWSSYEFAGDVPPADPARWPPLVAALAARPFVYVLTEFDLPALPAAWEPILTAPRPLGGHPVTVYRVRAER